MKSATFFCGGKLVPASRFRIHPIADRMVDDGWDVAIRHGYGTLDQSIRSKVGKTSYRLSMRALRSIRTAVEPRAGPALLQRLAWPLSSLPERILAWRRRPVVFDFDDAIFLDEREFLQAMRSSAFDRVCRASAHVVAGNSWLASMVPNGVPVTIIPTGIDTELYRPSKCRESHARVRIGWIGTTSNLPYLFAIERELIKMRKNGSSFDFLICSDTDPVDFRKRTDAIFTRWSPEAEIPFLQSLDIGIMPLADNAWCRGKCSFKIIQHMATGCPVVASDVGFNKDVVLPEQTGLLVNTDWADALTFLVEDAERRAAYGARARASAIERFDVHKIFPSYERILSELQ